MVLWFVVLFTICGMSLVFLADSAIGTNRCDEYIIPAKTSCIFALFVCLSVVFVVCRRRRL